MTESATFRPCDFFLMSACMFLFEKSMPGVLLVLTSVSHVSDVSASVYMPPGCILRELIRPLLCH